jgi:Type I phosphodiesterase / nucleotide pyrophosphatase
MPLRRSLLSGTAVVAAVLAGSCARPAASAGASPALATPTLVVFITVDQLRGDMLDRYRSDLRHGYARLMQGAWFVNAAQDHANTETAPGHASTMSGRFPRSTGIMSNSAGVGDRAYPLVVGVPNELGASPLRFQGTTLFDWLKAKDARTRAFSVSRKDRGAILPIGRAKEQVYWYSPSGNFTTSLYYRDALPDWVQAFNARRIPQSYAGRQWALTRPLSTYPEPDSVPEENGGRSVFPVHLPTDSARAAAVIAAIPAMDSLTALFALEGLQRLNLGRGPQTDILAVSFSTTDAVGHAYGPDSREAHENEIRLDETLGWFIDSLYKVRDSSTIVFALTSDHGVQPIPELARRRGDATGDQGLIVSLRDVVTAMRAGLRAVGADTTAFIYDGELVGLNRAALATARLNADSLLDDFRRRAVAVPGVARVDRVADVYRADHGADPIARRWSHQVAQNAGVDLVITLTRYSYWYRATATHGSPYDQDAHVPIIFYGPWIQPGRYTSFARTVDIGATLAEITQARPLETLDGVVLTNAIRR